MKKIVENRFFPKLKINSGNEDEEKTKFKEDIEKYILNEHYNHNHEKEIIYARITRGKI